MATCNEFASIQYRQPRRAIGCAGISTLSVAQIRDLRFNTNGPLVRSARTCPTDATRPRYRVLHGLGVDYAGRGVRNYGPFRLLPVLGAWRGSVQRRVQRLCQRDAVVPLCGFVAWAYRRQVRPCAPTDLCGDDEGWYDLFANSARTQYQRLTFDVHYPIRTCAN